MHQSGLDTRPKIPDLFISFDKQIDNSVNIEIEFIGHESGVTELKLNSWGGLDNLSSHITNFQVKTAGRKLDFSEIADGHWRVDHAHQLNLTISYTLEVNERQLSNSDRMYYRPIVNSQLFHMVGSTGLVLPQHLDGKLGVNITWQNIGEWQTVSSLGLQNGSKTFVANLSELHNSLFVAGPLKLETRMIKGNPLLITLHGENWNFKLKELADIAETITAAERDYFEDHDFPFYWINAISVGEPLENGYSFGGTKLHNNFALFLNPATKIEVDTSEGSPVTNLLAHEMMHEWIGGKLQQKSSVEEGTMYWFSEGFTNYLTRKVLLKSKLIDFSKFQIELNKTLEEYSTNPVKNATNVSIAKNFWMSQDYQKLPYLRGELAALLLDISLQKRQGFDISKLIKEWLISDEWKGGVDNSVFRESIKYQIPPNKMDGLMSFIKDGSMPDWQRWSLRNCAIFSLEDKATWDSGFDHKTSIDTHIISGVKENSAAYKAGLRDGQKLMSGSIVFNDIKESISIKVEEREEVIEYLPLGDSIVLPQVRLNKNCFKY